MMAKDRFSIRVQLVFRIFDSLTYRTAQKEYFRFSCDNHAKILPKEDGFFVVVGNEKPNTILLESGIYTAMRIDAAAIEENQQLNLWAEPCKGYHLVPDVHWMHLSWKPHETIFAYAQDQEPQIRLLENAEKGNTSLKIYQEKKVQLDGATMLLYSKDKLPHFEMITINHTENDICILSKPLQKEHKKIKTGIYPLMRGTADGKGICQIAVRKGSEASAYLFFNGDGQAIEPNNLSE